MAKHVVEEDSLNLIAGLIKKGLLRPSDQTIPMIVTEGAPVSRTPPPYVGRSPQWEDPNHHFWPHLATLRCKNPGSLGPDQMVGLNDGAVLTFGLQRPQA